LLRETKRANADQADPKRLRYANQNEERSPPALVAKAGMIPSEEYSRNRTEAAYNGNLFAIVRSEGDDRQERKAVRGCLLVGIVQYIS
jgi:hypothetical protein